MLGLSGCSLPEAIIASRFSQAHPSVEKYFVISAAIHAFFGAVSKIQWRTNIATAAAHLRKTLHPAADATGLKAPPVFPVQQVWQRRTNAPLAARRAVRRRSFTHSIAALCAGGAERHCNGNFDEYVRPRRNPWHMSASNCRAFSHLQRRILIKEAGIYLRLPQLLPCLF